MKTITLITTNQHKADFLQKHLSRKIDHLALDLDEIQSLDLREIAEHKVRQAYKHVKGAVLVEDVSLTINTMGKLPGPFIKWFVNELGNDGICKLAGLYEDREAKVAIVYAYFDGKILKFFEGSEKGTIAQQPRGTGGFGWNPIFIPADSNKTYAEMDEEETAQFSLRSPVIPKIRQFLDELDKNKA